jgi:hypothetical protein
MKAIVTRSALAALLFTSVGISQAAVTLQIISDNDFAVFVGTSTSVTRLIYQNNESWPDQISAAGSFEFDFEAGETTVYLLAMGGGGDENIGGRMNGVDFTTIAASQSSDLSGLLTNYATNLSTVADGTYSASFSEVSDALPDLTWSGVNVIEGGVGSNVTGFAFQYDDSTAVIYRFATEDIGVEVPPAVPEPGVTLLGLAGGLALVSRRRR